LRRTIATLYRVKQKPSLLDLKKIVLRQTPAPVTSTSRAFLGSDIEWNTICWHLGFCATTLSGLAIYKWTPNWHGWIYKGWFRYVGLGIAAGGAALMGTQIVLWVTNTDEYKDWITVGGALYTAYMAIQSETTSAGALEVMKKVLNKLIEEQKVHSLTVKEALAALAGEYYKPIYTIRDYTDAFWKDFYKNTNIIAKSTTWMCGTVVPVVFCKVYTPDVYDWLMSKSKNAVNSFYALLNNMFKNDIYKHPYSNPIIPL
jgi:hypothetical protein